MAKSLLVMVGVKGDYSTLWLRTRGTEYAVRVSGKDKGDVVELHTDVHVFVLADGHNPLPKDFGSIYGRFKLVKRANGHHSATSVEILY